MKSRYGLVAAATLLIAGPAFAEGASGPFMTSQGEDQHLAKDTLIGAKIYGKDGTIIGDIEDLILSDGNTVIGVIMGTGGFLGLAEKRIGLSLDSLQSETKDGRTIVTVPLTHEDIVAASAFQRSQPKKSLLERVKEKAQELTDKATETTKDAYEKAKPSIDKAKEKVEETYEKAKEKVEEAVGGEEGKPAADSAPAPAPEAAPAPETPAAEAPAPAAPPAKVETQPNEMPSWDKRESGATMQLEASPAPAADAPAADAPPAEAPAAETPAPAADAPATEAPTATESAPPAETAPPADAPADAPAVAPPPAEGPAESPADAAPPADTPAPAGEAPAEAPAQP